MSMKKVGNFFCQSIANIFLKKTAIFPPNAEQLAALVIVNIHTGIKSKCDNVLVSTDYLLSVFVLYAFMRDIILIRQA